jgi:hypothetical protein
MLNCVRWTKSRKTLPYRAKSELPRVSPDAAPIAIELPGFHNGVRSPKLPGRALGVQGEILSEKSGFELFVSFARLRHDFGKLAFSAQIAEQRIRFEIGITEETPFNTVPQHSQ